MWHKDSVGRRSAAAACCQLLFAAVVSWSGGLGRLLLVRGLPVLLLTCWLLLLPPAGPLRQHVHVLRLRAAWDMGYCGSSCAARSWQARAWGSIAASVQRRSDEDGEGGEDCRAGAG